MRASGLMHRSTVAIAALAVLGGCGPSYSPNTYSSVAVQQAAKVEQGAIVGVRRVNVTASGIVGGAAGAAAGTAAGASVPGAGLHGTLTAIGGGLVGGAVGAGIERATGDTFAYEYIIRKDNNELVSVTQKDRTPLLLGQRVLVIGGAQARIVPDYTVRAEPPKEAPPPKEPVGAGNAAAADPAPGTITPPKQDEPASAPKVD